ncbi:MAG: DNA translocase FtsK 4TM domain-containing protein [bacterium]|nr:DNA translocase FtsK 4TM domain-containing protein [bacterium]
MVKKQKIQEKSDRPRQPVEGGRRTKKRREKEEGFELPSLHLSRETKQGVLVVFLFAVAFLGFLSLLDLAGVVGASINQWLGTLFGWTRWVLPFMLLVLGYLYLYPEKYVVKWVHIVGLIFFLLSFQGLLHLAIDFPESLVAARLKQGGGYLGFIVSYPLQRYMGFPATLVVLLAVFLSSFLLTFETSLSRFREHAFMIVRFFRWFRMRWLSYRYNRPSSSSPSATDEGVIGFEEREIPEESQKSKVESRKSSGEVQTVTEEDGQMAMTVQKRRTRRKLDLPFDLLEPTTGKPTSGDIVANAEIIQRTLKNFHIDVEMGEVSVGPTVTQYTLKPAEGVRLSEITALNNDLALALAAHPIRIEAPIPGKALVGMEVPNQKVAIVQLRELLDSDEFKKRKSNMMIALGKDVSGKPWFADLPSMPHMLVAGSTGSGKSVCLNTVIVSLLYQNGPDDLKFILVDPKRVELPIYNSIPHLLTPVITDVKKTVNALKWLISEMDRRFDILAKNKKRDIASYNRDNADRLPYIVVIIDELADLMVAAANEVEGSIIRLAQMARAVGIHLIVATQRPSVDVLTGLIKANITSRIAFAVASQMDSRTILDTGGAEKLLGRGDLLFISPELSKPKRLQGGFVGEREIQRIVAFCGTQGSAEYDPNVVERQSAAAGTTGSDGIPSQYEDSDALLPQAKEVILQAGKASASLLQRRLKVGYARAARLLDLLEEEGFIGPGEGAKPREILFREVEDGTINDVDSLTDDAPARESLDEDKEVEELDAEESDDEEAEETTEEEDVEEENESEETIEDTEAEDEQEENEEPAKSSP